MSDRLLADALQARQPDALTAVYDAYGDRLYAYCWFQLSSHDTAQEALRDTLIVAEAHIGRLADFDRFGPWLYALARLQCDRWTTHAGRRPDMPIAVHDQEDVDQRIMAWGAVAALPPLSREAMELRVRHRLTRGELSAVLDLPLGEIPPLLDRARAELEAALTAEVLAREGPCGCPGRAAILGERHGELTAALRTRLLRHARDCDVCGVHQAGTVSPVKVYGLLPIAVPPGSLRQDVLDRFRDPGRTAYRLAVVGRVTDFGADGFPVQRHRVRPGSAGAASPAGGGRAAEAGWRGRAGRHRVALGAAAGLLTFVAGAALVPLFSADDQRATRAPRPYPAPSRPDAPDQPVAGGWPAGSGGGVLGPLPVVLAYGGRADAAPQPVPPMPQQAGARVPIGMFPPRWPPAGPMPMPVPGPTVPGPPRPTTPPSPDPEPTPPPGQSEPPTAPPATPPTTPPTSPPTSPGPGPTTCPATCPPSEAPAQPTAQPTAAPDEPPTDQPTSLPPAHPRRRNTPRPPAAASPAPEPPPPSSLQPPVRPAAERGRSGRSAGRHQDGHRPRPHAHGRAR